jgi:acetyl esterase/lipase
MKMGLVTITAIACLIGPRLHADDPIRLYDDLAPGSEDWTHTEQQYYSSIFRTEVVTNVVHPSLTPFLPATNPTGTAVIIAPGGGFHALSINSEGNDVAKWLNEKGIAAFVLRYRLFPTGKDGVQEMLMKAANRGKMEQDMAQIAPLAGADGLQAVAYVRDHADQYKVSTDRIGFVGFSAGGAVTAYVGLYSDEQNRPNFIAPIYAGLGELKDAEVPPNAPPMFLVAATNDPLGLATDSLTLYTKWLEAKKSVELHIYAEGGHGFGMKQQDLPSDTWIERFYEWMQAQGYLSDR